METLQTSSGRITKTEAKGSILKRVGPLFCYESLFRSDAGFTVTSPSAGGPALIGTTRSHVPCSRDPWAGIPARARMSLAPRLRWPAQGSARLGRSAGECRGFSSIDRHFGLMIWARPLPLDSAVRLCRPAHLTSLSNLVAHRTNTFSRSIFSCNLNNPSSNASGRGGQPGT